MTAWDIPPNPWMTPDEVADAMIANRNKDRSELRGRDLCCWCPLDSPCHADVLLEIANYPTEEL